MRTLTNDAASKAWDEAYALKAQIEAREADASEPDAPWLTIIVLLSISAAAYVVGMLWLGGL